MVFVWICFNIIMVMIILEYIESTDNSDLVLNPYIHVTWRKVIQMIWASYCHLIYYHP